MRRCLAVVFMGLGAALLGCGAWFKIWSSGSSGQPVLIKWQLQRALEKSGYSVVWEKVNSKDLPPRRRNQPEEPLAGLSREASTAEAREFRQTLEGYLKHIDLIHFVELQDQPNVLSFWEVRRNKDVPFKDLYPEPHSHRGEIWLAYFVAHMHAGWQAGHVSHTFPLKGLDNLATWLEWISWAGLTVVLLVGLATVGGGWLILLGSWRPKPKQGTPAAKSTPWALGSAGGRVELPAQILAEVAPLSAAAAVKVLPAQSKAEREAEWRQILGEMEKLMAECDLTHLPLVAGLYAELQGEDNYLRLKKARYNLAKARSVTSPCPVEWAEGQKLVPRFQMVEKPRQQTSGRSLADLLAIDSVVPSDVDAECVRRIIYDIFLCPGERGFYFGDHFCWRRTVITDAVKLGFGYDVVARALRWLEKNRVVINPKPSDHNDPRSINPNAHSASPEGKLILGWVNRVARDLARQS